MCGVAGILSFDGTAPDEGDLRTLSRMLWHRGPDDEGLIVDGPCGLVHRRLAIVDLTEAGHQPMMSADDRFALVFNGEVYNHVELRKELEHEGVAFHSTSDTEVVLAALMVWGPEAVERFNGMWALALWDRESRRLTLSRDRLGIKPLYLYPSRQRLVFASEVKALAAIAPELEVDTTAVAQLLRWDNSVFAHRSFFRGVSPLPAGTTAIFDAHTRRDHRFWSLSAAPERNAAPRPAVDIAEELRALLTDAVRLRFRADVAVGTCLSGGLDSSSIVGLASTALGRSPTCFSAVYPESGYDEGPYVTAMSEHFDLTTHRIVPTGEDFPERMAALVRIQDGPFSGPGVCTQWHVMKTAADRVGVLLDGQGADELFAGYPHYLALHWWAESRRALSGHMGSVAGLPQLHRAVARQLGRGPATHLLSLGARRWWWANGAPRLRSWMDPAATHHASIDALAWPGLLSPDVPVVERRAPLPENARDPLDAALRADVVDQVLPQLLHYEDRNSMALALEARVPFLDHRLVELAFTIPSSLKCYRGTTKAILRSAVKGVLPPQVEKRRDKLGYPTPAGAWFRRHQGWLRELLLSPRASQRGLLRPAAVKQIVEHHLSGARDETWRLTQLTTLELFHRQFVDDRHRLLDSADAPRAKSALAR